MFQIRIHGRGGQGVVTAAGLLSMAAFREDKFAQAFPSFGSERMGAPVVSFCRIDNRTIRLREPIVEPDAIIVQDPTLLHVVPVFQGLRPGGYVLLNSRRSLADLGIEEEIGGARQPTRCATVPATDLACTIVGRPLPNAALLGAFAALTAVLRLDAICDAIEQRFGGEVGRKNAACARAAHDHVAKSLQAEPVHAQAD